MSAVLGHWPREARLNVGYYPEDGIDYYGKVKGTDAMSEPFTFFADASTWCWEQCLAAAPEPIKCYIYESGKQGAKPYTALAKVWSRRSPHRHHGIVIYEGSLNAGKKHSPRFQEGPKGTVEVERGS